MKKTLAPKIEKLPSAKQKRLDELLDKNSEGVITAIEKAKLEHLVAEAERLMVANAKRLARFARGPKTNQSSDSVPVTVWVQPQGVGRR